MYESGFPALRRTISLLLLFSITAPEGSLAQVARTYPAKPVHWIIPYAAGGSADTRARQIAPRLTEIWTQPVVVENKPGAGGVIGTDFVAKSAPDGYTIGMGNFAPIAVSLSLMKSLPYDPIKDLAPVVLLERGPLVLMVNPSMPVKSVNDLISLAREKPGTLTFASSGNGSAHHLSGEMLKAMTGIDIRHVPYKGGAPAVTDLMGGHVSMMFELMYSALPGIRGGKLRALAVTSAHRLSVLPDIPTLAEAGVPGFESSNWQGVIAPAGTSGEIVSALSAAINRVLAMPDIRERIVSEGNEVAGGSPAEFASLIKTEILKWGKVVRDAGVQAD
jgi:tripartite-type tricarboxylate transporter receptor subunit TctC